MAFEKKKSTTKYLKFRGKVSWAKLYEPDDYKGDRKWKLNFYPSDETLVKMKLAGLQNKVKEDDGEKSGVTGKYVGLKRDVEKNFGGKIQKFTPPTIFDKDGKKLVWYEETEDGIEAFGEQVLIGNGSEVEVDLAVYQTARFGAGSRLNSVRIIDLIEYEPPEDVSENEYDSKKELDDDIPFDMKKPEVEKPKGAKVKW